MRKILLSVLGLLIGFIVLISYKKANPNPYPEALPDTPVPAYSEVNLDFTHHYDGKHYLPVLASAIIDIDNDLIPELFLGGGVDQPDVLFQYQNGQFVNITEKVQLVRGMGNEATYGANVIDVDHNGFADLIIARESGGYIHYNQNGVFQPPTKFETHLNEKSRPLSFGLADLNQDGEVDLFASGYLARAKMEGQNIFNKVGYGASSLLLLNDGKNSFIDITGEAGMDYIHNTFMGVFVDMDDDNQQDLVVAHDTGQVRTWRNLGNLKFENAHNPASNVYGYPMGIAVGDYDNNGLVDFYFSNVGPTVIPMLAKGDLRDDQTFFPKLWLFRNQGNFQFDDAAPAAKVSDYEFSWGTVFHDLNLDGLQDLIIAENYVDLPFEKLFRLPGRVLLQNKDHTFAPIEKMAGLENREYEITPLLADFNNDGYADLIRVNLGGKSKAFISKGGTANYLKVALPESPSVIGAKVTVVTADDRSLSDWMVSGEGLDSDQTHILTFGLGATTGVKSVTVKLPSGSTQTLPAPEINRTLVVSREQLGVR